MLSPSAGRQDLQYLIGLLLVTYGPGEVPKGVGVGGIPEVLLHGLAEALASTWNRKIVKALGKVLLMGPLSFHHAHHLP